MMYYMINILDYLVSLYMSLVQDINNRMFGIMAYARYLELLYVCMFWCFLYGCI